MKDFKYELSRLPEKSGIYLMKDKDNQIIYVGKAKNLKNRVRSYFNNDQNKSPKVIKMVEKIDRFEYIIVENEVEALVLESNFIKEHRPHYNILLRDDKQYPYIMITNEKFPKIEKVRSVKNDGNFYFGPYPNAFAVNDIIKLLRKIFKIRTCSLNFDKGQTLSRPCLSYYIGLCDAPCVKKADESVYMDNIEKIKEFLHGNQDYILEYLKKEMFKFSKELNFEMAANYRDTIESVYQIMEKQKVSSVNSVDRDIIAMYKMREYATIQVFFMRDGKIVDRVHFVLENKFDDSDVDIISSFMNQFYLDISFIPDEIIMQIFPNEHSIIENILSSKKGKKVKISVAKRGEKFNLLEMAKENAQKMMLEFLKNLDNREKNKNLGLKKLEDTLKLSPLNRIEAYDISNITGVDSVGSMVVYENGKKSTKNYRKFKIKTVQGPNDYAFMMEVLDRRFNRFISQNSPHDSFSQKPDLVIMDGGKGHVGVAKEVLKKYNLDIKVIGLVKDDKHKTKGIIIDDREIILNKDTAIYRFLYDIQEEVHRFALDYHNSLRKKKLFESELIKINGVGKKRLENLLRHFKSVRAIKEAGIEELKKCDGISEDIAKNIFDYFRG